MLKTKGHKIYQKRNWREFLDTEVNPRAEQFLETRGYDVLHQSVSNIQRALNPKHKWPEMNLLVHPNSTSIMTITKEEFPDFLDFSMEWFKENEYYEDCALIVNIRKKYY